MSLMGLMSFELNKFISLMSLMGLMSFELNKFNGF